MRIFIDTNVLVSAVATRGLCADVFREVLTSHNLIVSDSLLKEVKKALQQKLKVPPSLASIRARVRIGDNGTVQTSASAFAPAS